MTAANHDILIPVPPRAPRVKPSRLARWIGRSILRVGGWRLVGELPDEPRLVLIGAPHSSNWDGLWAFAAKAALGLDVRVLGKESLFRVPVLGWVLKRLGVIPIDRSRASNVVQQAAAALTGGRPFWYGLAPEGTRSRVERWKSGFLKIARAANVPILPLYLHYPDRVIGFGPLFHPGDDPDADMARIRAWYAPWIGKNRGTV
ncbi:lysophospholipid acyltransferase family protein [Luteimonas sp. BDR2-5]|uniref:lysophospholipid acyltransferase family protein n=1 Tax=Proluteimonas luteida TaxID=2878685 RepID=UPI001E49D989|nr:lysophospholipid acyltransferase family protein [Luteimonas sp. BDR2-5]MCD9029058.1 lysophospholipid acyltransferase family protein [Luteimonas sp. BDR2-5]